MGRIATPIDRFLPQLDAARRDAVPGTIVSATELAGVTGITWRMLETWIKRDDDFPIMSRGGLGVAWRFDLVGVLDYLIAKARSLQQGRKARTAGAARLAGLGSVDGYAPSPAGTDESGAAAGSAADMQAEARALLTLVDAQTKAHRLKREQRELVPIADVRVMMSEMMTTFQVETFAVEELVDPANQISPTLRAAMREGLRDVIVRVQTALEQRLNGLGRSAS